MVNKGVVSYSLVDTEWSHENILWVNGAGVLSISWMDLTLWKCAFKSGLKDNFYVTGFI